MSFLGGGSSGGGGGGTQNIVQQPYAPAQPALQQIISEAGKVYGGGVGQYVPPTAQTLTGLSQQESDAAAARSQLQSTLAGGYMNPYLNPLIQQAATPLSLLYASRSTSFAILTDILCNSAPLCLFRLPLFWALVVSSLFITILLLYMFCKFFYISLVHKILLKNISSRGNKWSYYFINVSF